MADEAAQLTGDLGGPPRLAAWQQAQRAEKERLLGETLPPTTSPRAPTRVLITIKPD